MQKKININFQKTSSSKIKKKCKLNDINLKKKTRKSYTHKKISVSEINDLDDIIYDDNSYKEKRHKHSDDFVEYLDFDNIDDRKSNDSKRKFKSSAKRKISLKKCILILSLFIVITSLGVYGVLKIHEKNVLEDIRLKEEKIVSEIESHYNDFVKVSNDTILYKINENDDYVEKGMLFKSVELSLEKITIDKDTKYFYIPSLDGYVSYVDVLPISSLTVYSDRYKNYVPYNKNVITKEQFILYDNNDKVYQFNESMSFPILINNYDGKYYVVYQDRLLYLMEDDVLKIVNNSNSNIKNAKKITTFCYHRVYDTDEKCNDIYVCKKKSNFEREMKYLKDNNYLTLTMEEMYLYLTNKLQIKKGVLVTLDDGHLVKSAIEVLEKYNLNATSFIKTKSFDDLSGFDSHSLELHSHTHDIHTAGVCAKEKSYQQGGGILCLSEAKVLNDLKTSREKLNGAIALAYPFYDYNNRAMNLAKKSGFKMAFIGAGGVSGKSYPGINLYKIPRITIWDNTSFDKWKSYLSN